MAAEQRLDPGRVLEEDGGDGLGAFELGVAAFEVGLALVGGERLGRADVGVVGDEWDRNRVWGPTLPGRSCW